VRRPQALAEVGRIALAHPGRFWEALDEFLDTFYLDHGDAAAQVGRLLEPPPVLDDALLDAWTGAVGEHLSDRWFLPVPAWPGRCAHFRLRRDLFFPETPALRPTLSAASPPAFRCRRIFTVAEPLQRARFPRDAARRRTMLAPVAA
jgi:hypothetical protein